MYELRDSQPQRFERYLSGFDWAALFGPKPEKASDLLDEAGRAQRLERTVLAVLDFRQRIDTLLEPYPQNEYQLVREWCSYLDKILLDEVKIERDIDGKPLRVHRRSKKEKGDDGEVRSFRLGSAADPEATFRMHGDEEQDIALGYNVQVAATTSGFVRETHAYTGAFQDMNGVGALISAQIERLESCPPKLIYDKAAGTGKIRAEVEQASDGQTQLVAQLPAKEEAANRFGPYDFTLSPDGGSLTCPHGKISTIAYPSPTADGRNFRFFACQCWETEPPSHMQDADLSKRCPLWEQCRDARQGPGRMRQVYISDYRAQVLAAEVYNQTEQFQKALKQRALIERVIFELTNYCGGRECRRRGQEAADYQAKMSATVYNLKLWMRVESNRRKPVQHGSLAENTLVG